MGIIRDLWEFCNNAIKNKPLYLEDWLKLFPEYIPSFRKKESLEDKRKDKPKSMRFDNE